MCKTDLDDDIFTPSERVRRTLIQKAKSRQVQRYYSKAKFLNIGESHNLEAKLQSITNTQHEFMRSHRANQKMFKIDRRRHIGALMHIQVGQEIKCLDEKRRMSSAGQSLRIASDLEELSNRAKSEGAQSAMAVLPDSVVDALHEGIPTLISKPRLCQRVKTAHPVSRRQPSAAPSVGSTVDSLRYLDRLERSESDSAVRSRLSKRSDQLRLPSVQQSHMKYPSYLALDLVEHTTLRAGQKRELVNMCKSLHAGSDDRCNELVKKWLDDNHSASHNTFLSGAA